MRARRRSGCWPTRHEPHDSWSCGAVILERMERLSERLADAQETLRTEIRDNAGSLAAMIDKIDDWARTGLPGAKP